MKRTPYKNALFVTYAVKAAFEKDPTVPPCIVKAVQFAIEDFTSKQAQALQSSSVGTDPPSPRGGGAPVQAQEENAEWKQRLAEAIDMVMHKEQAAEASPVPAPVPLASSAHVSEMSDASSLGGGGDDVVPAPVPDAVAPVTRRTRFSAEEIRYLRAGVEIHGEGQWAKMIQDPRLKFHACRTAVSLKDKWRNMGAAPRQKKV